MTASREVPIVDGLTGVPTYHAVASVLGATRPFGVFCDVDSLIWANDERGFEHGDRILVEVASILTALAAPHDGRVFRIAGDEFLAALPAASHDEALTFAHDAIRRVAELELAYRRRDCAARDRVAINAVVTRVSRAITSDAGAVREWTADQIWSAKQGDKCRAGVVADARESLPPWAR